MKFSILFILPYLLLAACGSKTSESISTGTDSLANSENATTANKVPSSGEDANDVVYEQIYNLLKEKKLAEADRLIKEKSFDITGYEERKHQDHIYGFSSVFMGLLWRFSGSSYQNFSKQEPNMEAIQFLLEHNINPNQPGFSWQPDIGPVVQKYVVTCDKKVADILIRGGSKYALDGLLECAGNEKDTVQLAKLVQAGADKNEALYWAAEMEAVSLVSSLIDKGAKILKVENRISHVAFSKNERLKTLIQNAIDGSMYSDVEGLEVCDPSSLINAAGQGDLNAVAFMLKAGADPNIFCVDTDNGLCESALGAAEKNNHLEVVDLLKKYGAKKPKECQ